MSHFMLKYIEPLELVCHRVGEWLVLRNCGWQTQDTSLTTAKYYVASSTKKKLGLLCTCTVRITHRRRIFFYPTFTNVFISPFFHVFNVFSSYSTTLPPRILVGTFPLMSPPTKILAGIRRRHPRRGWRLCQTCKTKTKTGLVLRPTVSI